MILPNSERHCKFTISYKTAKGECTAILPFTVDFKWRLKNGKVIFSLKVAGLVT